MAPLGVCRGLVSPAVSAGADGSMQRCSGLAVGTLLFSAWKLRQRGWISDPSVWQPLAVRQLGLVMGLTALSQVLGARGRVWVFQDGFQGVAVIANPKQVHGRGQRVNGALERQDTQVLFSVLPGGASLYLGFMAPEGNCLSLFCRNCSGSLPVSLQESCCCNGPFAQQPSGQKSRRREMNVFLFSVGKSQNLMFQRFVCFPEPAQGNRAVPVDGSVLCLTGILSLSVGMQSTPSHALLSFGENPGCCGAGVSAVRELKCIPAALVWVTGAQEAHLQCSLRWVPWAQECRRHFVKHGARQRQLLCARGIWDFPLAGGTLVLASWGQKTPSVFSLKLLYIRCVQWLEHLWHPLALHRSSTAPPSLQA